MSNATVTGGNASNHRSNGAWIIILVIGVIGLIVGVMYCIYRFMCKTVEAENELRSQTKKNTTAVAMKKKLPSGWEELHDDDGDSYYYHEASETTTWEHPSKQKHTRAKSTGSTLPPGWVQHIAEDGESYYENSEGGVQWEKP